MTFQVNINFKGIDERWHEALGSCIRLIIQEIAKVLNVERLDGITVAVDYPQALIELDRGFASMHPLTQTNDGIAFGIAMTPAVLRNGVVKSHIVLNAALLAPFLREATDAEIAHLIHTIAHELGHVHDLAFRDKAMPNVILKHNISDWDDYCLFDIADTCWQEYAACRLSAQFGSDPADGYQEVFLNHLRTAKTAANESIKEYRLHGELMPTAYDVARRHGDLMKYASYLTGHLDGLGMPLSERLPACQREIESGYFATTYKAFAGELRRLWGDKTCWCGIEAFDTLKCIVRKHLADNGMVFRRTCDNNVYIEFPFTEEAM